MGNSGRTTDALQMAGLEALEVQLRAALDREHGDRIEALLEIKAIVERLRDEGSQRARAIARYADTFLAYGKRDMPSAGVLARVAVDELRSVEDGVWLSSALRLLAMTDFLKGEMASASRLMEDSLEAARTVVSLDDEAATLHAMSTLAISRGEHTRANDLLDQVVMMCRKGGRQAALARALLSRSASLGMVGDIQGLLSALLEASVIFRAVGHDHWLAMCLGNLSSAHVILGNVDEALATARESVALTEVDGTASERGAALAFLAEALRLAGDAKAALRVALAAVEKHQAGEQFGLDFTHGIVASAALAAGELDLAEHHAEAGIHISVAQRRAAPHALGLSALGQIRLAQARWVEALAAFESALDLTGLGDHRQRAKLCGFLADAHEGEGDLPAAVAALKRQRDHLAEVTAADADSRLRHFQALHEVDRARADAAAASRDVTLRVLDAQEEERRHIARELHDDLSQRLALLVVGLELLVEESAPADDSVATHAAALHEDVRRMADGVHRISRRLHPASLERLGLVPAVRSYLLELEDGHGLQVDYDGEQLEPRLASRLELCLFRVVQGALGNVLRHAGVKTAAVDLGRTASQVTLRVHDEGCGFDADAVDGPGIGLAAIRERVAHLDGTLDIQSFPGHGTTIRVQIPVPAEDV